MGARLRSRALRWRGDGWILLAALVLILAFGCAGNGGPSVSPAASPSGSFRVDDELDDCFLRPEEGQSERVPCEEAVDITAVEFGQDRIIVEAASPIVAVGGRSLEFTAVMDMTDGQRLLVVASSLPGARWEVECSLGQVDATPLPEGCRASVEGRTLLIDLSPFRLEGEIRVGLLDISYFREGDMPGIGDFIDSPVTFTLE